MNLKISELIEKLENTKTLVGDQEVMMSFGDEEGIYTTSLVGIVQHNDGLVTLVHAKNAQIAEKIYNCYNKSESSNIH